MNGRKLQFGVAVIDGKVYVVGGRDGLKTLNSVECFEPQTKMWTLMPPMATHRHGLGKLVACLQPYVRLTRTYCNHLEHQLLTNYVQKCIRFPPCTDYPLPGFFSKLFWCRFESILSCFTFATQFEVLSYLFEVLSYWLCDTVCVRVQEWLCWRGPCMPWAAMTAGRT